MDSLQERRETTKDRGISSNFNRADASEKFIKRFSTSVPHNRTFSSDLDLKNDLDQEYLGLRSTQKR